MSSRQSEPPANDVRSHDYTERQRAHFTSAIRRRAEEMGIDEKERTTWLRTKLEALGEDVRPIPTGRRAHERRTPDDLSRRLFASKYADLDRSAYFFVAHHYAAS